MPQFNALKVALNKGEHPMTGYLARTKAQAERCNGQPYGIAIFLAQRYVTGETPEEEPLEGKGEPRKLMCVRADLRLPTRVCTTHIEGGSGRDTKLLQISEVATTLDQWIAENEAVVLMGDLNAEPKDDELDPIYAASYGGGAYGAFLEVDGFDEGGELSRTGMRTERGRKIDYIFLTENNWGMLQGKVTRTTTRSDHRILRGSGVL